MALGVELRLLGPVAVLRDGLPVRGFESRKALALLCYLVDRNQPAARVHMADLFWPELPEARGRGNLSRVLHNLSTLFPGALEADRYFIGPSRPATIWLDTAAFQLHLADGSAESLAAAAALYRGEFMADVVVEGCPELEKWLVGRREAWSSRVGQVLGSLVEHHLAGGDHSRALRFATRHLDLEPWREEAHREVIHLLARSGQRSAALAHYEKCRRLLREELGVEPSEETEALVERVRRGEIESSAVTARLAPPTNLPAETTSFIGRESELSAVAARLDNPECRLLTLVGPGGIGKTRLALRAAMARRHLHPDGMYLVPLGSAAGPEHMVTSIARAVRFTVAAPDEPRAQLVAHLRDKRLLLILDSMEHLVPDVGIVMDILQGAAGVTILATSRARLRLQCEWLLPIDGLPYPSAGDRTETTDFAAVSLFAERAGQVEPGFGLTDATRAGVVHICRLLEGVPLAVELAAAQVGEMACDEIAIGIAMTLDSLTSELADVPPRHRSPRAVFEQSWRSLTADERRALAGLSVFRGGFAIGAAGEVAGATSAQLSSLTERFLIREVGPGRFDLHALLRQYAAERLAEVGAEPALRERHARCFLTLAETARPQLRTSDHRRWLDALEREHDNLHAVLAWSLDKGNLEIGLRLASALSRFWRAGHIGEGSQFLVAALGRADASVDRGVLAGAFRAAAVLEHLRGDLGTARRHIDQSIALCEEIGDDVGLANALIDLGNIVDDQGDHVAGRAHYERSLRCAQAVSYARGIMRARVSLGVVAHELGELEEARIHYESSLSMARELGDRRIEAILLQNLATIESLPERERELLTECLALTRPLGHWPALIGNLCHLGDVCLEVGDFAAARLHLTESLRLSMEQGMQPRAVMALESFARLAIVESDVGRAARLLGAAAAQRRQLGLPMTPLNEDWYEESIATIRAALGEQDYAAAWSIGAAMALEQLIMYAVTVTDHAESEPPEV